MTSTRWTRVAVLLVLLTLGIGGCGGEDFENEPRPPVPLAVTGVITDDRVTISPDSFGAGPIVLTVSNQTPDSHTITLEGGDITPEEVGPINPEDTASLQKTLPEGTYTVEANSGADVFGGIRPGKIKVGDERGSAADDLELP